MNYYQQTSVINYPEISIPYTRIVEYKHFLNQQSKDTLIVKEFTTDNGEPYYPVPNKLNLELYEKYKQLTLNETNVHFLGRLANYKYFNMDAAILNALEYFEQHFDK
jgi:UDP-galactopyranose mutase